MLLWQNELSPAFLVFYHFFSPSFPLFFLLLSGEIRLPFLKAILNIYVLINGVYCMNSM